MEVKKIDLYEYFGVSRPENGGGYLNIYTHDRDYLAYNFTRNRPAMLVIAGGGYGNVSPREKEIIALAYMNKGFNCFTLDYSVAPVRHPAQLIEACMAIAYIRENAKEFDVALDRISAIGFSAGGHLCSMLATISDNQAVKSALGEKYKLCKPNAVVLSYSVITSGEFSHVGSFNNLCGENDSLRSSLSTETLVDGNSSPAFIWCTLNDQVVSFQNSMIMANAYGKVGVPFELHVFDDGPHGIALANLEASVTDENSPHVKPHVAHWFDLSVEWLGNLGIKFTSNV